ncbi:hypothetical protein [Arvimicrobium flavum]|uniref:hypothetical protein n=1 Tax=Arvimicrobium flavum TaxID=3393320 RepID=UPI00237C17FD|nr:hypothetical protein [Mesorhizobium shangrilense]
MDWNGAIARQREALKVILAGLVAMAADADTLPRCLHRAVLRLLRPAEAAARRLVIALAHTLPAPPARKARPWPPAGLPTPPASPSNAPARTRERLSLALFDRLRRPLFRRQPRRPAAAGVPRISVPGGATKPFAVTPRRPLSPNDPIDAARLRLRLRAVAAALDDLPRAARRFARWQARGRAQKASRTIDVTACDAPGRCAPAARPAGAEKAPSMLSTRC